VTFLAAKMDALVFLEVSCEFGVICTWRWAAKLAMPVSWIAIAQKKGFKT